MKKTAARGARGTVHGDARGIVCGTDFSENARRASVVAAALAGRIKEPLHLVHAIDVPVTGASRDKLLKVLMASRRQDLKKEAHELRTAGVEVKEVIASGPPDEVLVDFVRNRRPRLLVVSSVGLRRPERWVLGSVSERAAERAMVPTLVVRNADPLLAWARGERALKVFVCFNCTQTSDSALRWVKNLREIGPCEVVIGHVNWPPEDWARLGARGPIWTEGNPPEVTAALERDLHSRAEDLLGNLPFRLRIEPNWGRPDLRLSELAREEQCDLIVVGSHQFRGFERLWHGSISRGLLHQAGISVAVVPLATGGDRELMMTPPVRRVLATTDFSGLGDAAIPHAYSILRAGGTVHLLHVAGPPASRQRPTRHSAPEPKDIEACAARLRKLIPAEAITHGIVTQVEVVQSHDVADGICHAAERHGVDVICLSTHGRSGFSKALLGSVAQRVMSRTRRPVLVIRDLRR
jgi:nucleotide-binding universal stress UspA family protein